MPIECQSWPKASPLLLLSCPGVSAGWEILKNTPRWLLRRGAGFGRRKGITFPDNSKVAAGSVGEADVLVAHNAGRVDICQAP